MCNDIDFFRHDQDWDFWTFEPEFWPLIYARISFPLNIFRTN